MPPDPAARLRTLIAERGMTLREVAAAAGMSHQQVQQVISGKVANPGVLTLQRIVEAMGLTMAEFFAEDDSDP